MYNRSRILLLLLLLSLSLHQYWYLLLSLSFVIIINYYRYCLLSSLSSLSPLLDLHSLPYSCVGPPFPSSICQSHNASIVDQTFEYSDNFIRFLIFPCRVPDLAGAIQSFCKSAVCRSSVPRVPLKFSFFFTIPGLRRRTLYVYAVLPVWRDRERNIYLSVAVWNALSFAAQRWIEWLFSVLSCGISLFPALSCGYHSELLS